MVMILTRRSQEKHSECSDFNLANNTSTCLLDVKQVGQLKKTISTTYFKYGKKSLILTAIHWTKTFQHLC